jgi:hypothetical protein
VGPVLCILRFKDEDDARAIAEGMRFGLARELVPEPDPENGSVAEDQGRDPHGQVRQQRGPRFIQRTQAERPWGELEMKSVEFSQTEHISLQLSGLS